MIEINSKFEREYHYTLTDILHVVSDLDNVLNYLLTLAPRPQVDTKIQDPIFLGREEYSQVDVLSCPYQVFKVNRC